MEVMTENRCVECNKFIDFNESNERVDIVTVDANRHGLQSLSLAEQDMLRGKICADCCYRMR